VKPRLSILIPVYNEEENLVPLVSELETVLGVLGQSFEIILVDDGSTDKSPEILSRLAGEKDFLKVILFRRNTGQTAAFDAGFCHASGEIIITMDSDLQNDPRDIGQMLSLLDQGCDFVAGWRRDRKDGFLLRTLPSRIANRIIRFVTGTQIHDLGCSLKAYRKELTDELRLYGEMHRFIGVLMEGLGARIGEIEVHHRPRHAGQSKYNLIRTFKVLLDLVTVWFMQGYRTKPSYVFGGTGFTLLGLSGLISVFVLWQKFGLGIWVHRNPLFLIAVIFLVIGVQFIALGLLAELMVRTYFESSKQKPYLIARRFGFRDQPEARRVTTTTETSELSPPLIPCVE
jgi:glycosyltransferase involved in cell wall biosynthesis